MPRVYVRIDPMTRMLKYLRVDLETNCWHFTAQISASGYGKIFIEPGHFEPAHRLVYERVRGPVPQGHELHHRCHNKTCVNPWHLVTMSKADHRRLHHANPTHCRHGHEYTPENTLFTEADGRRCRACNKEKYQRRYVKKGRQPVPAKSHCVHGHELNESTLGVGTNGRRFCRVCHRLRERERVKRLKEARQSPSTDTQNPQGDS